jgi:dienelactone hydrolase
MRYVLGLILTLIASSTSNGQSLDNPTGDWYINANGSRLTLSIAQQGNKHIAYIANGGECNERLDNVTWNAETGLLEFRRAVSGITQWFRVTVADGVMVGRFSHANAGKDGKPSNPLAYKHHVTGWSHDHFNQDIVPVVFDINANHNRGRLRIDRLPDGRLVGRLKFYVLNNSVWEYPEEEITVTQWDGEKLEFIRGPQVYSGAVEGRDISGVYTSPGRTTPWSGSRAELLTYGIAPKSPEDSAAWRDRTRRQLYRLMMAGNPAPLSVSVEVVRENLPPIASNPYPLRDDDPSARPQNYTLTELRLTYTLSNWLGGEPITRTVHAYLAKPTTPPPNGLARYPLAVAVNGHKGSAYQVMDGGTLFWYGDAFARRGYMVLAVDIGHRPSADVVRSGSVSDLSDYLGYPDDNYPGDDPANGNGLRPSIKPPKPAGFTDADWAYYTEWEEDGERTWDVMRAIDYALSRPDVDPQRIAVTGLSMGGEVASYVGALDPRVGVSIPAGYSPDLNVLKYKGVHCWHWSFADYREYLDQSDVLALTAPRMLIVQTGKQDTGFSIFPQHESFLPSVPLGSAPFAADKQVIRRARAGYGAGPLFHYLHPLAHEYRTGVTSGGLRYTAVVEPRSVDDLLWQVNSETTGDNRTLFDYVAHFLNF